jgi:hypothetical protein
MDMSLHALCVELHTISKKHENVFVGPGDRMDMTLSVQMRGGVYAVPPFRIDWPAS